MDQASQAEAPSTELVSEHTEFQSHMPYMGIDRGSLTMQQEKLVSLVCSGMTTAAAGRGAGYSSPQAAYQAKFSNQHAHMMYMEAYNTSANATEMKNTTDSLVKLHGLAAPENATQVNININGTKQLERMTDEDLLKIAGKDIDYLEPKSD